MTLKPLSVGFLGAGYISQWHAAALKRTPGVRLSGVCDRSAAAAQAFAKATGAEVYRSLDAMLAARTFDCIHVLTPPDSHFDCTQQILKAGVAAFVEKPLALSSSDATTLVRLAEERRASLGVNHNFLMLPGYERLERAIDSGVIGPIDSFTANWRYSMPALRSGPFGAWMLRSPLNLLFELSPHLFAFVAHTFGEFDVRDVELSHPIEIPGGVTHHQSWRIAGRAGRAAALIEVSLVEGAEDRSVEARGAGGSARFDFGQDAFLLRRASAGEIIAAPFLAQGSLAAQSVRTAVINATRQIASLNELAPYGLSMMRACRRFYASLRESRPVDRRLSAGLAASVAEMIEATARAAPGFRPAARPAPVVRSVKPTMLVIGGSGFIGRALVDALAENGVGVRVFSRGRPPGFDRPGVEVFSGDLKSDVDLMKAMQGIEGVFHLARAEEKSWDAYLENDVMVTRRIGQCSLEAGVKRLVYAGTIAAYDASKRDRRIDETTPFDSKLDERDLYARSKAACEAELLKFSGEGLALVIVRPGIVIGRGGPLQHWGVARWRNATTADLWGRGDNILPFVAIDDVADGFMRAMSAPGVEGRSFNLVGEPFLSARDYFAEVERANGVAMQARPTPIWTFFAVDMAKYIAKRLLARRTGLTRPRYRDWATRAALSTFDNRAAKEALGWRPEADRAAFIRRTIDDAALFGWPVGDPRSATAVGDLEAPAAPHERGGIQRSEREHDPARL